MAIEDIHKSKSVVCGSYHPIVFFGSDSDSLGHGQSGGFLLLNSCY